MLGPCDGRRSSSSLLWSGLNILTLCDQWTHFRLCEVYTKLTDEALLAEANCHGPENLDTSVFASECVSACILAKMVQFWRFPKVVIA